MRKFLGFDEIWNRDGTGTKSFWIFFIKVWETSFSHSTTWVDYGD